MRLSFKLDQLSGDSHTFVLTHSEWDDWFTWNTQYIASYHSPSGHVSHLGSLKIGATRAELINNGVPKIPVRAAKLEDHFFSLGQDDSYYSNLAALPEGIGLEFLKRVNDLVIKPELYEQVRDLEITTRSLLRFVSVISISGQFRRIIEGDDRRRAFEAQYVESKSGDQLQEVHIPFDVVPGSTPPSNVHVLIGRNGSGKTRLLQRMARSLVRDGWQGGKFVTAGNRSIHRSLAGVGLVSFSAFDNYPRLDIEEAPDGFNVFEIGLKKRPPEEEKIELRKLAYDERLSEVTLMSPDALSEEMAEALYLSVENSRERWLTAVAKLESDPVFAANKIQGFAENMVEVVGQGDSRKFQLKSPAAEIFATLSSGHKVVLLAITSLVAHVQERTVVLFDEPEGHLHPPLLSALVRAISWLLGEVNAFAIVATHSPVILQEVPLDCVHLVRKTSDGLAIGRPRLETFGESIGVLTREVFGLEVDASGFHSLIDAAINSFDGDADRVLSAFGGSLGGEALAQIYASDPRENLSGADLEF